MKSLINTLVWFSSFLFLVGCVPSLHPLYTEKDLIFEPKLVGTWTDNDKNQWDFTKSGEKSYLVTFTENSISNHFEGHLITMDSTLYLDLYPETPPDTLNSLYTIHLFPVHTFSLLKFNKDVLTIAMMDYDSFKNLIHKNKNSIQYKLVDDSYLITADTPDIQKFIKLYSNEIFTAKHQVLERVNK